MKRKPTHEEIEALVHYIMESYDHKDLWRAAFNDLYESYLEDSELYWQDLKEEGLLPSEEDHE